MDCELDSRMTSENESTPGACCCEWTVRVAVTGGAPSGSGGAVAVGTMSLSKEM